MADQKKSDGFGIGLIFGALAGAVAALFLTPTTGEENRKKAMELYEKVKQSIADGEVEEKAKELFGDVTEEGTRLIAEVRKEVLAKLEAVKSEVESLDTAKFTQYIDETVASVGARVKASAKQMERLKASMLAQFEGEVKKTEKAKKVLKPKINA